MSISSSRSDSVELCSLIRRLRMREWSVRSILELLTDGCRAGYGVDNVVDRFECFRIREKQASQAQCAGFAIGAQTSICNALKVDHMREADDAADHLAGAEAEHVGKQATHEF